jgi:hypothetical protein
MEHDRNSSAYPSLLPESRGFVSRSAEEKAAEERQKPGVWEGRCEIVRGAKGY